MCLLHLVYRDTLFQSNVKRKFGFTHFIVAKREVGSYNSRNWGRSSCCYTKTLQAVAPKGSLYWEPETMSVNIYAVTLELSGLAWTLHDSVMSRLGHLEDVCRIMQT